VIHMQQNAHRSPTLLQQGLNTTASTTFSWRVTSYVRISVR